MKRTLFFLILILSISSVYAQGSGEGELNINVLGNAEGKCSLNFKTGWNFFSFCNNLEKTVTAEVFASIYPNIRYILRWNRDKQEFEIYSPKSSKNPITSINDNESYFIYLNYNSDLDVEGTNPLNEFRFLINGWNAPSYQSEDDSLIADLLFGIQNKIRYILKWNVDNQEFKIYSQKSLKNSFDSINRNEGYFIYAENSAQIIYP